MTRLEYVTAKTNAKSCTEQVLYHVMFTLMRGRAEAHLEPNHETIVVQPCLLLHLGKGLTAFVAISLAWVPISIEMLTALHSPNKSADQTIVTLLSTFSYRHVQPTTADAVPGCSDLRIY